MIRVNVGGMILDENTRAPVLLLHVPNRDRYLPIWIGPSEAASISLALKNERFERPLTHDLLVTVVDGLGGCVKRVIITDQRDGTYFAKIFVEQGPQVIGIDARPSDSVAVAVRTGAPIYVTEVLLGKVADSLLTLDEDATRSMFDGSAQQPPGASASNGDQEVADGEESDPRSSDADSARDDSEGEDT